MIHFSREVYDRHVGLTLRSPRSEGYYGQGSNRMFQRSPSGVYQYSLTPLTIYQTNDDDAMYHRESWRQRGYHVGTLYIDSQPNIVLVPVNR